MSSKHLKTTFQMLLTPSQKRSKHPSWPPTLVTSRLLGSWTSGMALCRSTLSFLVEGHTAKTCRGNADKALGFRGFSTWNTCALLHLFFSSSLIRTNVFPMK